MKREKKWKLFFCKVNIVKIKRLVSMIKMLSFKRQDKYFELFLTVNIISTKKIRCESILLIQLSIEFRKNKFN